MKTLHQITRTLRGGSALQALALVGASAFVGGAFAAPAAAQDYTSGAITGNVETEAGEPIADATVTVTSVAQGFSRTSTTSSSGAFRVTGLPAGQYNVVVEAAGQPNYRAEGVVVRNSQTSALTATLAAADADAGGDIVVTGTAITQSFEGTTTGLNVDVADTFKAVPINRDLTSLILLSPNTSGGDSAFGNLASVGGSSVAENAYYLNGLNITNFDNYLGSADVPFEFYQTLEVKQGGYPAEFGRATGGIVNAVSKSGSNDFTAAMHVNWLPNFLDSNGRDLLNCDDTGCVPITNRRADETSEYSTILELGGPIIRDRLFVYGLAEFRSIETTTFNRATGVAQENLEDDPRLALKVDAYPIDDHHLEFTLFDTRNTRTRNDIIFEEVDGNVVLGNTQSVQEFNTGGVSFVGKYTGRFTDWLTVSGAYGRARDRFDSIGTAGDATLPFVQNLSGADVAGVPFGGIYTGQGLQSLTVPYETEREFYRGDVDLFFSLLGDHHIRAGFDVENNTLDKTSVRTGGAFLLDGGYISDAAFNAGPGNAGLTYLIRANGQVEVNYFNSGGSFTAQNKAFYIQDEWAITDRLTLNLGLRRDDFSIDRGDGDPFAVLDENYQPRIGFTYDLFPDRQGKFFGSYGTYYLPIASNTAFRQAGNEFFFRERYLLDGFDANGIPILGAQVTNRADYQSACPFGLTPQSSGANCSVTGDGSVGASDTLIDANLKATKQTEFIVGYEHQIGEWTFGINYTHRRLDTNAEDVAIDAAVLAYCDAEGIAGCEDTWTGFHQYSIINPGSEVTVALDGLDGRTVTFTPDQLGYPDAERTFDAVELSFERPFDGRWSLNGSYVWSKAQGNSEGFVQSDFGQSDAGITQDFDQPGFLDGAFGLLPSHRRHRFKLFGAFAPTESFLFGANIRVDSPRPLSCLGFHPTDPFANVYGAASRYCGGVLSPRGTAQESEWVGQFDFKVAYNINIPSGQVVTLRADVFNLLNSQAVDERNETGDLDIVPGPDGLPAEYIPNPNYGQATSYQTPRYVRLGLDVSF